MKIVSLGLKQTGVLCDCERIVNFQNYRLHGTCRYCNAFVDLTKLRRIIKLDKVGGKKMKVLKVVGNVATVECDCGKLLDRETFLWETPCLNCGRKIRISESVDRFKAQHGIQGVIVKSAPKKETVEGEEVEQENLVEQSMREEEEHRKRRVKLTIERFREKYGDTGEKITEKYCKS